jgi:hypothetical protein
LHEKSGVIIRSVPPHTIHNLQALHVAVNRSFRTFIKELFMSLRRKHCGKRINQYDVTKVVKTIFEKSSAAENATHGFRKCTVLPLNRYMFTVLQFSSSDVYFIVLQQKGWCSGRSIKCGVVDEETEHFAQQNGNSRAQFAEPCETGSS